MTAAFRICRTYDNGPDTATICAESVPELTDSLSVVQSSFTAGDRHARPPWASGQTICFVGGFRPVVGMPPAPHISLATATPDLPVFPGAHTFPRYLSFTPAHSKPSPPVGWGSNPPCHACMRQSHRRPSLSPPNESRQHAPDPDPVRTHTHTLTHKHTRVRSPHRPDLGAAAEYSHHSIPLCTEGSQGPPV